MNGGEIKNRPASGESPKRQVIAIEGPVHHWIEPWYLAYAILVRSHPGSRLYSFHLL